MKYHEKGTWKNHHTVPKYPKHNQGSKPNYLIKMYNLKFFLFAVVALFAFSAIADVTGKFNIVSKYKFEKVGKDGKKTTEEQRNPVAYEKKGLKSDKTLEKMVADFGTWSGGEFKCSKGRAGNIYNVEATVVFSSKDKSNAANTRAKQIINSHASEE